jgi:hypothetical protein
VKRVISKRSFFELLQQRGFRRVSFREIKTHNPEVTGILKKIAMENEDYESLDLLENKDAILDTYFACFLNMSGWPIVMPLLECYDEEIYSHILTNTGIKVSKEEIDGLVKIYHDNLTN